MTLPSPTTQYLPIVITTALGGLFGWVEVEVEFEDGVVVADLLRSPLTRAAWWMMHFPPRIMFWLPRMIDRFETRLPVMAWKRESQVRVNQSHLFLLLWMSRLLWFSFPYSITCCSPFEWIPKDHKPLLGNWLSSNQVLVKSRKVKSILFSLFSLETTTSNSIFTFLSSWQSPKRFQN